MRTKLYSEAPEEFLTGGGAAAPLTLVELLRARAHERSEQTAYTFLSDGETEEDSLTYGELDRRTRAVAARLQRLGARGERVLLVYPPGLDYIAAFFGCLYAGMVAVPVYPPRANSSIQRLQSIIADAHASLALTSAVAHARMQPLLAQSAALRKLTWLVTDNADADADALHEWRDPQSEGRTLAFLQYTSGSTATPKGVMVTHANLLHNERMIQLAFRQTPESVIVSWLPLYHDMGLIGGVLQPLYLGAQCVLMSPMAFLQRPACWLEAISRYRATTSGGPNFAYDLCVRKIASAQRAQLDLSSWEVAFNGAEPVRAETLERFAEAFASCGFRRAAFHPCYGLAEGTLLVSGGSRPQGPSVEAFDAEALAHNRVMAATGVSASSSDVSASALEGDAVRLLTGCGAALLDQQIIVVNPERLTACAPDEVGEIWVSGQSIAVGYWNRPEETEQTFHARLSDTGEGPFLRTGDLGFRRGGELFVTGRLKDLIIIRGRNLYPSDIERTAEESHAALRQGCGAAFSVEVAGEERLVLVQEVERRWSGGLEDVLESIRQAVVEEHEVHISVLRLVKAGSVPKTSSGKIQRRACREMFLSERLEGLSEWREAVAPEKSQPPAAPVSRSLEEILIWLRALLASKCGVEASRIEFGQPLTHYALDSLLAVELMHAVETNLGVVLPMTSFLQNLSLAELAAEVMRQLPDHLPATGTERATRESTEAAPDENTAPPFADSQHTHPLSHGQQALWFLSRLSPDGAAYHVAAAVRIRQEIDAEAMRHAFQTLVDRHPALHTTFISRAGEPLAYVHERMEAAFEVLDAKGWDEPTLDARLAELAHRPFALDEGPLVRVSLVRTGRAEFVLLLAAHHLVVDFWSLAVMLRELGALYESSTGSRPPELVPLPLHFAEHVKAERRMLAGERGESLRGYWERRLAGAPPALNLNTDRPRPPVPTSHGASHALRLDASLTRALKALGRRHRATLYMTLLAAFQTLLHRHTGQQDILVGTPTSGRGRAALANLVGYFVNPLVLRSDLSGDPGFDELLARVRQTVLDAFEHQEYPFPLLVQQLVPERDASRSPLFQVMFVLQGTHGTRGLSALAIGEAGAEIKLGKLVFESVALNRRAAQFDLSLAVAPTGEELLASFEYNTDLFDAATIERLAGHFRTLLEGIIAEPRRNISALPLMTEAERRQLASWNETATEYGAPESLLALFEAQAARTPAAPAVEFADERLSYAELNARANQLAERLRRLGVGPDVPVGVLLERSVELVVALLAVLKAGGAYVPLDPSYPAERLAFMLEDARVPVLLTQEHLRGLLPAEPALTLCLDTEREALARESASNLPGVVTKDNLAYTIFTSGSTGRPKGAMNTHGGIVNRLLWMQAAYGLTPDDCVLQKTPFSFDVSVWEFFWPLITGARLVLARPGGQADARYLADLIESRGVTTLHFVPSMLRVFLEEAEVERCRALKRVICSGEALGDDLQERFFERLGAELHNLYGPTEAAVDVTFWACVREGESRAVPIGRPIANTDLYVLDKRGAPVPVGVPGELHIGGCGLARGYANRPALTAERFIPHAFSTVPGARLYRTGDLARWLPDGNIEFLGRLDFQVKVRGNRIELGEVETSLAGHEGVRDSIVVACETGPDELSLVAYVVGRGGAAPAAGELRRYLAEKLPDYMIPSVFVALDALPLTPNGKVDRKALPAPPRSHAESEEAYVAPRNQVEELVAGIWSEVLGVGRVGTRANFFELGGHSLLATRVLARVQKAFQIELPLRVMFEAPTVAQLARRVDDSLRMGAESPSPPPLGPAPKDVAPPLSFAQQRLWFLEQFEPGNCAYHMPGAVRLTGALDTAALKRSLDEIVRRHESLRTSFAVVAGEPVQLVAPPAPLPLPFTDLSGEDAPGRAARLAETLRDEARRPFDLGATRLVRARLVRMSEDEHVLTLTMHHAISDGASLELFLDELATLYGAYVAGAESPLPELTIQYPDFAHWQRQALRGEMLEKLLAYWRKRLGGPLPTLDLPIDRLRPASRTSQGARQSALLTPELTAALIALSRREGVTLFMTLLAAFNTLLYRYTGQSDLIVGTPHGNRRRTELEGVIGFFVNTLVLRTDLSGNPTFRELLRRVRETMLEAYAHQDLPFEKLIEELQPERDASRNPLFQVMVAMQKEPAAIAKSSGLTWQPVEVETGTAKFDLTLGASETERGLLLTLEYSTDLFEPETATRMLGHLRTLLEHAAADSSARVAEVKLLTEVERRLMLDEWNETPRDDACGLCIHELFEARAAESPAATALIFEDERITYGKLNARANQVAHYLRRLGVGPESPVGLYLERTPDLIVALLGVLKAGGAYVPIDQAFPRERVGWMLEDARVAVLLTQARLCESLPEHGAAVVCLDADNGALDAERVENPARLSRPENLAYVIYTSGSTGQPKGVAVTHGSVVTLLQWAREVYDDEQLRGVLASTSVSFDISVFEIFLPLSTGGRVLLARDALELPYLRAASEVTLVNTVPSAMAELLRIGGVPASVRTVNLAGEALKAELVRHVYEQTSAARVWNLYGPTEDTVYSTHALVAPGEGITIGRPVAGTRAYVLDANLRPVPVGVAGELLLGGRGLARGYLNRPELTADKFIPDPYGAEPGARLYRTGDLARYLTDGRVEYLGRLDYQVKIRGFRIEMDEIETALSRHPSVRDVVVTAQETDGGDKRLVAYLVAGGESVPTVEELRGFLRQRLPEYMTPSVFVVLDALPLTPNGKVDRKALPEPEPTRPDLGAAFVAPRTPHEARVAAVWAEVLRVERVGVNDNFFALGGHSLLATQVVTRLREAFRVDLPLRGFFESPTVAEVAALAVREQVRQADSGALAEALAQLEELTAEEVQALLATGGLSNDEGRA